jgi:hypothetical protein
VLLPVTPFCCAVAWDSRFIRAICGDLQKEDQIRLNVNQLQHCTNFIYESSEPDPAELAVAQGTWKLREPPAGQVSPNYCDFNFLKLKDNQGSALCAQFDERPSLANNTAFAQLA